MSINTRGKTRDLQIGKCWRIKAAAVTARPAFERKQFLSGPLLGYERVQLIFSAVFKIPFLPEYYPVRQ